jgi:predicted transcriptional regulator
MKTIVSAWVDVDVAARLDDAAAKKRTTRSTLIVCAIQHFLLEHADAAVPVSVRDGADETAKAIVQVDPSRTIREHRRALADAGIRRSTGWISNTRAEFNGGRRGRSNRDGQREAAKAIVQAHAGESIKIIRAALAEAGIARSTGWVSNCRADLFSGSATLTG